VVRPVQLERIDELANHPAIEQMLNRGGLILCGIYSAIALPLFAVSYLSSDIKAQLFWKQLAMAPAMILTTIFGAENAIVALPWLNSVPCFFLLNLLMMYPIGWGISRLTYLTVWGTDNKITQFDHRDRDPI
jgi:hypothetical protein